MKKILLTGIFFYCLLVVTAQTPVAWYRMDNDFNDYAGTNNGTSSGVLHAFGHFTTGLNQGNQCGIFNGTGSHINLGSSGTIRPTAALTVSAWFTLENTAGAIDGRQLISCTEASGYNMGYDKVANTLVFQVFRNGGYGSPSVNVSPYVNNGWHHITGTFDGRYTKLYIDGQLQATDDAGGSYPIGYGYPFGNVNTYIGAEAAAGFAVDPNYYWQGKIDELKIYNIPLTGAQIKAEADFLPGSGKAIDFTGSYYLFSSAVAGVNDFAANQDFTVECWFKAPLTQTNNSNLVNSIISNSNGPINYDIYIYNQPYAPHGAVTGSIGIQRWDGSNNPYSVSAIPVNDNKWHHCALVRSGGVSGTISLYIDGILQTTIVDNTGNSLTNYLMKSGGVGGAGYGNFNGNIDEIRIWNIGLTATQLRERMCRKIAITDPLWSNLTLYYRCDEDDNIGNPLASGVIINDSKNGEIVNATFQAATVPHVTSGAPLGNASSFSYSASPTATLSHPQGESLQAAVTSGSPDGIQVYSVNEVPNTKNGTVNVGGNDRYFGVFVIGGSSPQYTVTYNYDGNPHVTGSNESSLLLYRRDNNADNSWEDCGAALNVTANTLTATGQNTEYLLGGGFSILPVSLLQVELVKQNNSSLLRWATLQEQNNRGFEVLHSTNGSIFTPIGFVAGMGNSGSRQHYSFLHHSPAKGMNYYRIRQVDEDGKGRLSHILRVDFAGNVKLSVYPNPVTDQLVIQAPEDIMYLRLLDSGGRILWKMQNNRGRTFTVNASTFSKGILMLQVTRKDGKKEWIKLVKQ